MTGLHRRGLLAGAALLGVRAARAAAVPREVLVFYYAWYGDVNDHPDWRGIDAKRRVIANTEDYPTAGPYSSADPVTVRRQLRQMQQAGITGLIYSWWGRGRYEDANLPLVLSEAEAIGLKVSIYYEVVPKGKDEAADVARIVADFAYLDQAYCSSPAWLRVDGRAAFFIYTAPVAKLGSAGWRRAVDGIRAKLRGRPFFSSAAAEGMDLSMFDAIHRYGIAGDMRHDLLATLDHWDEGEMAGWADGFYGRFMRQQRGFAVTSLTVFPGYDDTVLDRARHIRIKRYGGTLYRVLWRAAVRYAPAWILITSWNEWHEASEIEPSDQYGDRFLQLTSEFAPGFVRG